MPLRNILIKRKRSCGRLPSSEYAQRGCHISARISIGASASSFQRQPKFEKGTKLALLLSVERKM